VEKITSILKLNNVEVMYHEVILVLKGVSIEVPQGGLSPFWGPMEPGNQPTLKIHFRLVKA